MPLLFDSHGRMGSHAPSPTPAPLPAPAGVTSGYTAGATAMHSDGQSTGGVGGTGYTIGDLVAALKQSGVIRP